MKQHNSLTFNFLVCLLLLVAAVFALTSCEGAILGLDDYMTDYPIDPAPSPTTDEGGETTTDEGIDNNFQPFCNKELTRSSDSFVYLLGENSDDYAKIIITYSNGIYTITPKDSSATPRTFTVDDDGIGHISATDITVTVEDGNLVLTEKGNKDIYND